MRPLKKSRTDEIHIPIGQAETLAVRAAIYAVQTYLHRSPNAEFRSKPKRSISQINEQNIDTPEKSENGPGPSPDSTKTTTSFESESCPDSSPSVVHHRSTQLEQKSPNQSREKKKRKKKQQIIMNNAQDLTQQNNLNAIQSHLMHPRPT